jgi:PhzF family phenazine biosynthesis protein
MADYRFFQIDAFAEKALTGGPAAVIPFQRTDRDAFPEDALMRSIAAENNLAETAFLVSRGAGVWDLRWFTPTIEVPLCGHATLASAHAIFEHLGYEGDAIGFDTKSGRLTVRRLPEGRLEMDFPSAPPVAAGADAITQVADAVGATPTGVFVSTMLLAVFDSAAAIRAMQPDLDKIANLRLGEGMARGNLICAAPGDEGFDVVSRFFAPGAGIPEDPATGAAHCVIAPHFSKLLGKPELVCFQAYPGRGAHITTRLEGDRVKLIGRARTVIEGVFRV